MANDQEEKSPDLISDEYVNLLQKYRKEHPDWGNTARKYAEKVDKLASAQNVKTILDFGCGTGTLAAALKGKGYRITGYDPSIPEVSSLPEQQFDMVVCIDVMEHVEEEYAQEVINTILDKADKAVYFLISCIPAKAVLPDGRNAHITIKRPFDWHKLLKRGDFPISQFNFTEKAVEYTALKCKASPKATDQAVE